jgi:glycosyltransferase involved in cell wall biosynthesis
MEKLKLLHIIETLSVEGGGGDRACAELAEAQAQNGHDVTILCTENPDRPTPITVDGVSIISVPSGGRLGRELGWNPNFHVRLMRALENMDIVHSHGTWRMLHVYVRTACRRRGVPYVQQPHGSLMPTRLLHRRWFKLIWGMLFERRNLAGAAALHAETPDDLVDIRSYFSHRNIYILPCGSRPIVGSMNTAEFETRYPQLAGKNYVLYLGRLDFQKGVDMLISAFADVFKDQPDVALVIVGPDYNDTKSKLLELAQAREIANVIFLPAVTNDLEKKAIFSNAACFVLPSHSENFGITVLEALLSGCPTLVSRNTGWASLEEDGGGLVFNPTPDGVRDALRRFVAMGEAERSTMVEQGQKIAADYDWRVIARKQDLVYADILADRRSEQ